MKKAFSVPCFMKKLFKAPCNITTNNTVEYNAVTHECVCVRFGCGKIKWKKRV